MKIIHAHPETTLAEILEHAAHGPIAVERDGVTFEVRLVNEAAGIFDHYDPAAAIEALDRLASAFRGVDAEQWKAEVRETRH